MYFLSKGRAAFVLRQCENLPFVIIEEGDEFGVIDLIPETRQPTIVKEVVRVFTVMATEYSEMLCLSLENLAKVNNEFPSIMEESFQ